MEKESRNSKGYVKVLMLAAILILPAFLYYLLEREGTNNYISLPIYGEKILSGTFTSRMGEKIPDTIFHQVPEGLFISSTGEEVAIPARDSSISVVNFFFTRCVSFCTHMNNEMDRVASRFSHNPKVRFYTLSVDTAFDRPDVLGAYIREHAYQPEEKKWHFLTGLENFGSDSVSSEVGTEGMKDVLRYAREGWLADAVQDTTQEVTFIHSSSLMLMDSQRRIRGYYDVTHSKEVDRLMDEINLLLVEEVRQRDLTVRAK